MKHKAKKLRDAIIENIEYLSKEYQLTEDILSELNMIVRLNMSHSMIFLWWEENEQKITTINKLLDKLKKNHEYTV